MWEQVTTALLALAFALHQLDAGRIYSGVVFTFLFVVNAIELIHAAIHNEEND